MFQSSYVRRIPAGSERGVVVKVRLNSDFRFIFQFSSHRV